MFSHHAFFSLTNQSSRVTRATAVLQYLNTQEEYMILYIIVIMMNLNILFKSSHKKVKKGTAEN